MSSGPGFLARASLLVAVAVAALGLTMPEAWGASATRHVQVILAQATLAQTSLAQSTPAQSTPAPPTRAPAASAGTTTPAAPPATTEPAAPASWSQEEVAAAQALCISTLAGLDVVFEQAEPIRENTCGTPAPIRLARAGGVEVRPPAVVNCAVAAALVRWLAKSVQPNAAELLGKPVRRLANVSAYVCRGRNGISGAPLSEHAFANAIDIAAFELGGGGAVTLARHWGPTERDLATDGAAGSDGSRATGNAATWSDERTPQRSGERQAVQRIAQAAPTARPPAPVGSAGAGSAIRPLASRLAPMTPDQAVDVARLDLRLAEARLSVAERQRTLLGLAAREGEVRARRAALAELPAEAYSNAREEAGERRRGGRSRSRSGSAARDAPSQPASGIAIPPAPKQNPGTGALDRARREAERNLARIEAEQRRLEVIEAARARAEAVKARDLARIDGELRRAERQTSEAREQLGRAEQRYDAAVAELAAYLDGEGLILAPPPAAATPAPAVPGAGQGAPEGGRTPQLPERRPQARAAPAPRSTAGGSPRAPAGAPPSPPTAAIRTAEARFLRALHNEACGIFTTVLGPEANEAHRDHFHLDMAPRRRSAYCE